MLLNKLIYFKLSDGESQKHVRDIGGMFKLLGSQLDEQYVTHWASKLDVIAEWEVVLKRMRA